MGVDITPDTHTAVYLHGDGIPVVTEMTMDEVLALVADIESLDVRSAFVRLPLGDGMAACVRPASISVICPARQAEDDD